MQVTLLHQDSVSLVKTVPFQHKGITGMNMLVDFRHAPSMAQLKAQSCEHRAVMYLEHDRSLSVSFGRLGSLDHGLAVTH